jgi:predicted phosphodiesterase
MILETGKRLAEIIEDEKPDLIVNLGDTFDQHTITSYDVNVASEFFKCFRYLNIPHLVLVGNHEMINYDFNAIEILSNINNITVITEPCTVDANIVTTFGKSALSKDTDLKLAFMPYMEYGDILSFPDGKFLFSHIDILGMKIRGDYELPDGVKAEQLSKYQLVFNGHIHKPSIKGNVVNVGSISTHSFADDNDAIPQCYIFDTDTMNLQTFKLNICPLFRKFEIKETLVELETFVKELDTNYKYVLQVTCPFELKENVKEYLSEQPSIIANKLNVKVDKTKNTEEQTGAEIQSNVDVVESFKAFLETVEELKYPKELYLDILKEVK